MSSSHFPSGRPFSPAGGSSLAPGAPHHVRRTSGSAGGSSFLAENLGFARNLSANAAASQSSASSSAAPNNASNAQSQSRSPQQRPGSSSSAAFLAAQQQQMAAMQQLSLKLESQQLSQPSSASSSSTSTPSSSSHRSSFSMSQIAHAQSSLNSLKRSSLPPSSSSSSHHHSPQPPYPITPSTLSSSTSSPPSSSAPPSHLKIKRKIRKNTREKQRRSELNDKFDALQELLQLGGGQTKVEKFSVLHEAITVIEVLRKENEYLKGEKVELRGELKKLTDMLKGFFPHAPEMAKEFTGKFFPKLSALSPQGSLAAAASQYGSGDSVMSGVGPMFPFQPAQYHSGQSMASHGSHQSHLSGGSGSLSSSASFLLSAQQQAQAAQEQALATQHATQQQMGAYSGGGSAKPPSHRRSGSRNGSSSSVNLQSIYSSGSSIPGLGMGVVGSPPSSFPPPLLSQLSSSSTSSLLNGFSSSLHRKQPSLTMPPHVRIPSIKSDELKMIDPFARSSQSSMAISPTSTSSNAPFPFHMTQTPGQATDKASAFPSSLSQSSSGHRKQPSQDFKYSLSSLTSLHGRSPSPPVGSHHARGFSGQNQFNVNFNVTIPQADDGAAPSFDSPAGVGLFGGNAQFNSGGSTGLGAGSAHGHHLSSGSLGGWVGPLTDAQGMDDVGGSEFD